MKITPESRGLSSAHLEAILRRLNDRSVPMHSLLVARGDDIILNAYWAPFTRNTLHRMNSITKSYVALAIGCLIDEGRVRLDDKVIDFFPEVREFNVNAHQASLTVEDMLSMRTGYRPEGSGHWVRDRDYLRIKKFFERVPPARKGEDFCYDSAGSYVLGALVEKLTGMSFLEYLKEKFLLKIGFSKDADCVMGGEGYSWSDSGLLCTTEDLYRTARFMARGGKIDGVSYLDEKFLSRAVSKIVSTEGDKKYRDYGYGYQIWKGRDDGFMFVGMYAQLMLCIPSKDIYICCTADNQNDESMRDLILDLFYETVDSLSDSPLPEDEDAYRALTEYVEGLKLASLPEGEPIESISDMLEKNYKLSKNPMEIDTFRVTVSGGRGVLSYVNAQGDKELVFGIGYNELSVFPEDGYPDMVIGESPENNRYPIAASATVKGGELIINVKFIGKHLAALSITVGTDKDGAYIRMSRTTECFLHTYNGEAFGVALA